MPSTKPNLETRSFTVVTISSNTIKRVEVTGRESERVTLFSEAHFFGRPENKRRGREESLVVSFDRVPPTRFSKIFSHRERTRPYRTLCKGRTNEKYKGNNTFSSETGNDRLSFSSCLGIYLTAGEKNTRTGRKKPWRKEGAGGNGAQGGTRAKLVPFETFQGHESGPRGVMRTSAGHKSAIPGAG